MGANVKDIYRLRGFAYLYNGDCPKAIEDFTQVVKLNKNGKEESKHTGDSDYALKEIKFPENILDLIDDILKKMN